MGGCSTVGRMRGGVAGGENVSVGKKMGGSKHVGNRSVGNGHGGNGHVGK